MQVGQTSSLHTFGYFLILDPRVVTEDATKQLDMRDTAFLPDL